MRFLVVEDSDDDTLLIERAFRRAELERPEVARDGAAALARLHGENADDLPHVVLLDLKLHGMDGVQVLETIRADPRTRGLPVVILSTSDEPRDVQRAYDNGANGYLRKPVEFDAFVHVVSLLAQYWAQSLVPGDSKR